MLPSAAKSYDSFAAFEREELRPMNKVGFCLDDLEAEASAKFGDEQVEKSNLDELDFG
jgi:hypothetical protein